MANENLKKWLAGGYVEAPDFLKELKNAVNEIDHLKETVRIYKVCDELAREHSKKVKHVFPLETIAGYGQLCDKVVEQQKEIDHIGKMPFIEVNNELREKIERYEKALTDIAAYHRDTEIYSSITGIAKQALELNKQ